MIQRAVSVTSYFNPRPPRGGRQLPSALVENYNKFQSTPPARGATKSCACLINCLNISIHAPREGGDCNGKIRIIDFYNFNPRPPRGGRL